MVANVTLSQVSPSQPCSAQDCPAAPICAQVKPGSRLPPAPHLRASPPHSLGSSQTHFLAVSWTCQAHFCFTIFSFPDSSSWYVAPSNISLAHFLSIFFQVLFKFLFMRGLPPSSEVKDASLPSVTPQLFYFQSGACHHPAHVFVVYVPTMKQKLLRAGALPAVWASVSPVPGTIVQSCLLNK